MNATKAEARFRRSARSTPIGRKLIGAFKAELAAIARGEPEKVRVTRISDEPGEYGAADVRALRHQLGATQRIFARLVGVSAILVHSWEHDKRQPSRLARRLLDEIAANPDRWAAMARRK